jgi:hypothetical protein
MTVFPVSTKLYLSFLTTIFFLSFSFVDISYFSYGSSIDFKILFSNIIVSFFSCNLGYILLIEYSCLEVPAYRLRFQIPYRQLTIKRCFRMFRETIYHNNIEDLKPLLVEKEMDETVFAGKRPGSRD